MHISPTTPEGMKVSFYCKMLLRKCLLHISDFEAHASTYTHTQIQSDLQVYRDGFPTLIVQGIQCQSAHEFWKETSLTKTSNFKRQQIWKSN